MKLCITTHFFRKNFFAPEIGEMILFYNKIIICCVPKQIVYMGKSLVPEIYAKMLSANQIARFLDQVCLQNKSMKQLHF